MNNITYADDVPKDIYKPSFYYDGEEVRPIPDAEGYYVSESGKVYSTRKGEFKLLKSSLDSRGNYLLVSITIDGIRKRALLHRLVAKAFVSNPDNLPEVNHKDKNKQNCYYTNLEWCTRKENLNDSYSTMGPTRNYRVAKLYRNDELIGEFEGIAKAARYANKKFGVSFSSLDKYLRCGEFRKPVSIIKFNTVFILCLHCEVYNPYSLIRVGVIFCFKTEDLNYFLTSFRLYKTCNR